MSQQGWQLKVVGTFDDPQIERKPLPAMNDMLEQLQTGMYEGAATMTPTRRDARIAPAGDGEAMERRHDHGTNRWHVEQRGRRAAFANSGQRDGTRAEGIVYRSSGSWMRPITPSRQPESARPNKTRKAPSATPTAGDCGKRQPRPRKDQKSATEIEAEARQSKDPTGQSGTQLDLTG